MRQTKLGRAIQHGSTSLLCARHFFDMCDRNASTFGCVGHETVSVMKGVEGEILFLVLLCIVICKT